MRLRTAVAIGCAMTLLPSSLAAQHDWSLELRLGAGIPTKDLGTVDLDPGFGSELTGSARVLEHLWVYAGWGYHRFETDAFLGLTEPHVEQTGYVAGIRFEHPLAGRTLALRVSAGATYEHLEIEGDEETALDSGHDVGWDAGAGLVLPLGTDWRLTPGVRYRSLSTELEDVIGSPDLDLSYLAIEVGIARRF